MDTQVKTEKLLRKSFLSPDEVRSLGNGELEQIRLGRHTFSRLALQPGWRWSRDVKPTVNVDSCQARHAQYVISGRLMIQMDDGTRTELVGGDAAVIPPGHDAWVVGDEPVSIIDFAGEMRDYARTELELTAPVDLDC